MRRMMMGGVMVALLGSVGPAQAEVIERACLKSDRPDASRMLCGCIQDLADITLSRSDQRKAAGFFDDPHKAQEVRQSNNRRDAEFWTRYKRFGEQAKTYCS